MATKFVQAGDLPWEERGETSTHVTPPFDHMVLQDHKTYLHYHNIYGHKAKQDGDLPWLSFTHNVKWPHNHVVLWDQMTN